MTVPTFGSWKNFDKTRAAELLGICLKTLHNKLKEYGTDNLQAVILEGFWANGAGEVDAVTDELRQILLDLWKAQGSPISGYILVGPRKNQPIVLDNLAKRSIRNALNVCVTCKRLESEKHEGHEYERDESLPTWPGWYGLRRFHATEVCKEADAETAASALRNSKEVAKRHYIRPETVLPKTRQAVNDAFSGLAQ